MAHIFFMPEARIDAKGRTSIFFAIGSKNFRKEWYPGVFRVTEYEFGVKICKFKMADILGRTGNLKNLLDSDENRHAGVFEVSDNESTLKMRTET